MDVHHIYKNNLITSNTHTNYRFGIDSTNVDFGLRSRVEGELTGESAKSDTPIVATSPNVAAPKADITPMRELIQRSRLDGV